MPAKTSVEIWPKIGRMFENFTLVFVNFTVLFTNFTVLFVKISEKFKFHAMAHNVVSTSIQRYLDVMDVRWTSFWRCVPAGMVPKPLSNSQVRLQAFMPLLKFWVSKKSCKFSHFPKKCWALERLRRNGTCGIRHLFFSDKSWSRCSCEEYEMFLRSSWATRIRS